MRRSASRNVAGTYSHPGAAAGSGAGAGAGAAGPNGLLPAQHKADAVSDTLLRVLMQTAGSSMHSSTMSMSRAGSSVDSAARVLWARSGSGGGMQGQQLPPCESAGATAASFKAKLYIRFVTPQSRHGILDEIQMNKDQDDMQPLTLERPRSSAAPSEASQTSGGANAWQFLLEREAPEIEGFVLFTFVLPVGFYETREFKVTLYDRGKYIGCAECGFAWIRIADIGVERPVIPPTRKEQAQQQLTPAEPAASKRGSRQQPFAQQGKQGSGSSLSPLPHSVTFSVEDIARAASSLNFCVSCRFAKQMNWPYGSPAPFLVLYRATADHHWVPIYRSEVRFRIGLRGKYVLKNFAVDMFALCEYEPTQKIRMEFFHFTSQDRAPILLAYSEFTVLRLQTASHSEALDIRENVMPSCLIDASFQLEKRSDESERRPNTYYLEASFLPKGTSSSVFFDVSVTLHSELSVFAGAKLSFSISKAQGTPPSVANPMWVELYRSEMLKPDRRNEFLVRFEVVKLTRSGLSADQLLRFDWYACRNSWSRRRIGASEISLSSMRLLSQGSGIKIDVVPELVPPLGGRLVLHRMEETVTSNFFAIQLELGDL
ncbi:hypothetical protein FVE85_9293 [Porphyridium purpureum]|uniref:Uncharacterized protein n=1 Tax=Porphyridium purpureum TaxID=35688 RepID=A0A5J4YNC4_PORPP|nr:hypothetical protein FVE85_9293 [Porphyridium purpureum]|eukprot:POR7951..scf222_8